MLSHLKSITDTLAQLVQFRSISPEDNGCQAWLIDTLQASGFKCTRYDKPPVSNFFARLGTQAPLLVFAGHTDVVSAGDASRWLTDPYHLTQQDNFVCGRGTADMKGAIACMLEAAKCFISSYPQFKGSLGFLITSGEEGDDFLCGTLHVMQALRAQGVHIDYCIVGEPSAQDQVGDTIKIGRRGSLSAKIHLEGKQGHVAYPHLANNPIHAISPMLAKLCALEWDKGNAYFPPTTMQITKIEAGGEASNIIPGYLDLHLNFRFSTEQNPEQLQHIVMQTFQEYQLTPSINWTLNGSPFLTAQGTLLENTIQVIENICGAPPILSTSGGTSDGRFIAPYGVEVIELGLCNATIHQVNECVRLEDLKKLSEIYFQILCLILS